MLHKRNNSVITLTVLLAVVGVSKPAKAFLLTQADEVKTAFTQADELPKNATVQVAASNSINSIDQGSKASFTDKYPNAKVNIKTQSSDEALNTLAAATAIAPNLGNKIPEVTLATADSSANANADANNKVAQADGNTPTPTQINPDLEGSGTPNSDLEGSGKVDPDLESSGTPNFGVDGSGKVNPEFQDSGVVNSDVKESGEVNSDVEGSGTAKTDAIAQTDANPNAADTENAQGDAIATKKGYWWWWIPLIVGLPLLGLLGMSSLKRGNRSDREPAIANIPSPNDPQGGSVTFDPDIDGVSPRETTATTGDLGTTSNLDGAAIATGGAALAGGAAATNRIGDRHNKDIEEVDTDRLELENVIAQPETDIDNLIVEIPSDPVNEFTTDQETKLQTTEQSARLQDDDLNDSSGLLDNISASGAALGGSAAASGFFSDREDSVEETTESVTEDNDTTYAQSSYVDEPDYPESTADFDRATEENTAFETENAREFRGDYVLREEIPIEENNLEIEDDDTTAIRDANWINSSTNEWNAPESTVSDSVDNTPTTEVELSEDEDRIFEQTSGFANDATQTEGAAASGFFTNRDSEQSTEIDSEDINWVDSDTSEWNAPDNIVLDSVDSTPITEVELSEDENGIFEQTSGFANDATQTEGAAASGFFANRDSEQSAEIDSEDINWVDSDTSEWNAPDNIVLDSVDSTPITEADLEIEDSDLILDTRINNDFETNIIADAEVTSDETDYSLDDFANSDDISLDEITLDDADSSLSASSDEFTLDDTTDSGDINVEEITFDDADSLVNAISDEFTLDDTTDSRDISLDEITLDDADSSLSASSDEFAFDETTDSGDISVEEITFDDADSSVNASLDEFAFDETTNSGDINLDEITFEDADSSVSASPDEFTFDETTNSGDINLDEITFDDADSSIDDLIDSIGTDTLNQRVNLDELGFDESSERKDNSPSDLLSGKTAEITDLADDKSDDMDNISTWLDGLETPDQNTENISEWLENLNADSANSDSEKSNSDKTPRLNEEDEDISFQFLEDLLDRDPNANQDDK